MHELAWIETENYTPAPARKSLPPVLEINARVVSRAFGEGIIQSVDKATGAAIVKFDDGRSRKMALTALASPVLDGFPREAKEGKPEKGEVTPIHPSNDCAVNPIRRLLSQVSQTEQEAILKAGGAIKIVVLAAGNDDGVRVLCRAAAGPGEHDTPIMGRDCRGLSSIELMQRLCDLPDQAPKGTHFVWYGGRRCDRYFERHAVSVELGSCSSNGVLQSGNNSG